ncbi:MAG: intradiol ring-cleavage dioxygenase [Zoogloeaceae bacterium]|nr:intradiol ring-cleavage dioxygenase [Zoogloeaceae bacterium]
MLANRRRVILGTAALLAAPGLARAALATPRQSAGPFYPLELPLDHDNDLVHVAGRAEPAKGVIADLSGRLLDLSGRPLAGTRIEIWQCDANGRYRHPRESGSKEIDAGFQGFGRTVSDGEGRYRFLTIRPVPYPGRTPHIHVAVFPSGREPFVTQLYVAGESRNADDFLYRSIPVERRGLLTTPFEAGEAGAPLRARWDVVLDAV